MSSPNRKISLVLGGIVILVAVLTAIVQYGNKQARQSSLQATQLSSTDTQGMGTVPATDTSNDSIDGSTSSVTPTSSNARYDDDGYDDEDEDDDYRPNNTVTVPPARTTPSTGTALPPATSGNAPSNPSVSTPAASQYTLHQVAAHNSQTSCWAAVNSSVYDLTSWINQHPGGEDKIISLCGTDGSAAFNDQHGGQSKPENTLAGFKIGTLIK